MKKIISVLLNIIFYCFVTLLIFNTFSPMYNMLTLSCDSLEAPWEFPSSFLNFFRISDHCWFIMSLFWSISVRFIPALFKIHPQTWMMSYYPYILLVIMLVLQVSIIDNFTKYFKNTKFKILWAFLLFPVFCCVLNSSGATWILTDDCWTWAYLFLPIFSVLLFSLLEKNYVKNDSIYPPPSKINFLFLSNVFLFICVAFSHEYSRFILCLSIFIGYILHYFFVSKNINHKKFWISYVVIIALNTFLFILPCYHQWLDKKLYSFSEIISLFSVYLKGFIVHFLIPDLPLIFLIFALVLISFAVSPDKKESKKISCFAIAMLISILLFPIVIMIGHQNNVYSFEHCGIKFMSKFYLLNVVLSLLGYIMSSCKNFKIKIISFLLCFSTVFIFLKPVYFVDLGIIERNEKIRQRLFILERIFDLYGKKYKTYVSAFQEFCLLPSPAHLGYFKYLYDSDSKFSEYKYILPCSKHDDYESCNKKLIKFLKDKTGYELTEEEIKKQDFQKYYLPAYQ